MFKNKNGGFMKKLILLVLLITSIASLSAKNFVVGVEAINYYPHYSFTDGSDGGFAKALLDLFAEKKGYTFVYKPLPVKRLFNALVNNEVDFKYPDSPFWSAEMKKGKNIVYSDGVVSFTDGVYVLPENKGKGIAGLKRLGIVRGFTPWDYLKDIKEGKVSTVENTKFIGMLKQALRKRSDGAYGNKEVIEYVLKEKMSSAGELVFDPDLPHSLGDYKLSTGKHAKVIKEFNDFLKTCKTEIAALKQKYHVK